MSSTLFKKLVKNPLVIIAWTGLCLPVLSKPYLRIQSVNPENYPYIKIEVSVSSNSPIENLTELNFGILENNWKVNYFRVKKTEPEKDPKRITLLIDSSKSLSARTFESQIAAASLLVNAMLPNDQISVLSFDDNVEVHCGFTTSREQVHQCLKSVRQNGRKTVFYDAIYKSIQLNESSDTDRNFIVLFTDGKDEGSSISMGDILELSVKFPVFAVCTGTSRQLKELSKLTHWSGGEIYNSPNVESVGKIYSLLGTIIDNTYQLEYVSQAGAADQNTKPVNVEVRIEFDGLRDQDIVPMNFPMSPIKLSVKNVLQDERFYIFLGASALLFLLIAMLIWFSRRSQAPKISKKTVSAPVEKELETLKPVNVVKKNKAQVKSEKTSTKKVFGSVIEKEGPYTGTTHKLAWETTTIGHGNENSIVIDDPSISYNHAKIVLKNANFYIYDMLSDTGVFVNGKKLLRPKILNDFDEIRLGRTVLLFRKTVK